MSSTESPANKNVIKRIKNSFYHLGISAQFAWNASKPLFIVRLLLEIFTTILPIITVWVTKQIINTISWTYVEAGSNFDFNSLLHLFGILLVLMILSSFFGKVKQVFGEIHTDKLVKMVDLKTFEQVKKLDISYFDAPKFYDEMLNSERDSQALQTLSWVFIGLVQSLIQLISCVILLGRFSIHIPIVITVVYLPAIYMEKVFAKKIYKWQRERTPLQRKIRYFKEVLTFKKFSKELRVYNLFRFMLKGYDNHWTEWYEEKKGLSVKKYLITSVGQLLPQICFVSIMLYVALKVVNLRLSIGDYSFYYGLILQFSAGLTGISTAIIKIIENELKMENYLRFLSWEPITKESGSTKPSKVMDIEFKNVSFKYPSTERYVLKNINFSISKKEKVAIVGLNGAGKSTLIKLLLRLYEPTEGSIYLNGINITEYSEEDYKEIFSVVFQDYSNFSLTIRENIVLSDLKKTDSDAEILDSCAKANALNIVNRGENGLDTYLTKVFDRSGLELSGGEWQKIALARAFLRNSEVLILDEPNASLDPESEQKIYHAIYNLSKDKCAIFITHRLSSVSMADKIIVIESGQIVEMGTHEELFQNDGLYANMFNMQAKKYIKI